MLLNKNITNSKKSPLNKNVGNKKKNSKSTKIIYRITKIYLHQKSSLQQIKLGQTAANGGRCNMPEQVKIHKRKGHNFNINSKIQEFKCFKFLLCCRFNKKLQLFLKPIQKY